MEEAETHAAMTKDASGSVSSAAAASAAGATQYRPLLLNAHAAKGSKESFYSRLGANFNLSSFFSYYPMLRLFGYGFEAGYSPITRTMQSRHLGGLSKIGDGKESLTFGEKIALKIFPDQPLGLSENPFIAKVDLSNPTTPNVFDNSINKENLSADFQKPTVEDIQKKTAEHYKKVLNRSEAVAFTSLAAISSYGNYKQMVSNFKLAVGAELGKDPKEVTFMDLRRSNNPIVVSAMDRFLWQTPIRVGAGMAFMPGLGWGIAANSLVITTERTIFYRPLAYDILAKAVNDVQINSLGQEAKGEVVDNLIRVMQAQRFDHRQALIPREQIDALRPTLNMIADDVINKRFGITGMMYVMGGGVLIPEDPAQSQANYQHVRDVGVSGVMEEAKKIRQEKHVPSTRIWEARLIEQKRMSGEEYVAESARRDELLKERRAILARGPLHATPGSEIDPTARYGAGVQMY